MNCVICKQGETQPGATTVTLERGGATLVVRKVPTEICRNCGEVYLSEQVTAEVLAHGERAFEAGVLVNIREFTPAA